MPFQFILFFFGISLLTLGSSLLVRGSSFIARYCGVSSLVVGLTVVAYGTSTPELVVSTVASWYGQDDMSFGNVIGSNIFNSLFIVGLVSLLAPIRAHLQLIFFDMPLTIALGLITLAVGLLHAFTPFVGLLLLGILILYTLIIIKKAKTESPAVVHEFDEALKDLPKQSRSNLLWHSALVMVGLGLLIVGAEFTVSSASSIARAFGVSELVIALTIVAGGTSLPELATSLMASYKKEHDIALGNVVGSSVYNILAILGVSSLFAKPEGLEISSVALTQDVPIMLGSFALLFLFAWTKKTITRIEGALLLSCYALYVGYLVARSA